ncbi:ABC transporter substrate-binding protein [Gorillibacterium sp. sgz500922]|uniref:ABC transporter substrate-binding protein n=1 Tax=Gorillibacterium sp. sgz500922 TaxID=3446694 RepID=UPI003F6703B7
MIPKRPAALTAALAAVLLAAAILSAGCAKSASTGQAPSGPPATSGAAGKPAAPVKLSIMLDWYPNAVHSFLYVAQDQGIFAAHGLEVAIEMPSDTNDALRLAAAGKVDLALSYQPQILLARSEGVPVKSIASIVRHPLNRLMALKTSGITRPRELEGKTIGFSSIPLYEAMAKTMVQADGGDPGKVKLTDVGFSLIPALAARQTDATLGGFLNHEKLLLEKEGHPVAAFDPVRYGVPDYSELVLAASDSTVGGREEALREFLAAIREAQAEVANDPARALEVLLKHEDQTSPLDKDVETKSLGLLLPLMTEPGTPFGSQSAASWEEVRAWLSANRLISDSIQAADAFVSW